MATHDHSHTHAHDHDHGEAHDHHDAMDDCIEACLQCHVVTTMTAQYCLAQGGEMADMSHVGLLLDTAEIAQTSANFMLRGSPFHTLACGVCAELCRACAEACRSIPGDDEHLLHCAQICESCASHCEEMVEEEEG